MVGQLEAAHALCHGPRKRPFLVPEELAFEQSRGNGRAIQLHEGVRTPRAQVVNGACNELFARASLAGDEDGRLGGRTISTWCSTRRRAALCPTMSSKDSSLRISSSR